MTVIIDTSGAIEVLLQKGKAIKFSKILQESTLVLAPDLFIPELTNTLWKYHRANIFNKEECVLFINDGLNYVDKFINSKELWLEAFSEGIKNNHSVYDMLYMVTARRNDGTIITADSILTTICKKNNIQVC